MFEDVTALISSDDKAEDEGGADPRPSNCQDEEKKEGEQLPSQEEACAGRGDNNES